MWRQAILHAAGRRAVPLLLALALSPLLLPASRVTGAESLQEAPQVRGALLLTRLTVPRKELFLQEVFEFTLTVCSRGLTMGREISLRNQETPGLAFFSYVDLGSSREVVDGRVCDAHRFLGRAQAVATGDFAIRPYVLTSVIVPRRGGEEEYAETPSGRAELREVELRPPPLTVTVRPLPEAGMPEGFTGAVGSFAFSASAHPAVVAEGEPVTLSLEIRGRGNVESLAAPRVQAGDRFRVYEPKLVRREISADRSGGRLVFEQTLVPRSTAPTSLPAVSFSYFDPEKRSYRQLLTGPFPLRVMPSAQPVTPPVEAPPSGPAAGKPAPAAEIAPLKGETRDWTIPPPRPRYLSFWFIAMQCLPPALAAVLLLAVRRREELARDVVKSRRQLAADAGRSRLGAAELALKKGDPARFHEALWEALTGYFGHRLNLLPGEVSREAVTERLSRAGLDARDITRLAEIFEICERQRFGRPPHLRGQLAPQERQGLAIMLEDLGRILQACEEAPK